MRLLGKTVLPETVADSLNMTAEAVTEAGRKNIKRRLTVRTKFTLNSLTGRSAQPYDALNKAMGHNIQRMYSRAGTKSPYLSTQETGDKITADGSRVPIPTLAARRGQQQRRISRAYNLRNMGEIGTTGRFFIGVPKGGSRPLGIYERYQSNKRLRMIRNLESRSVTVPAVHWHKDAVRRFGTQQFIAAQFKKAAQKRLSRVRGIKRGQ